MGQQIVGDLAGALTGALNAAIPALLDNLNPMAKIKSVSGIVGGFVNCGKDAPAANGAPATGAAPAPAGAPSAAPKQATDPAYSEVQKLTTFLAALQVIIAGKDSEGNIDWEKARGADAGNAKSSIGFIKKMIGDSNTRFSSIATSAEPSVTLCNILESVSRVCRNSEHPRRW